LIYKAAWLAVYAAPRLLSGDFDLVPLGIAGSFAAIVLIWLSLSHGGTFFTGENETSGNKGRTRQIQLIR